MPPYPKSIVPVNHVEAAPRRVRGFAGDRAVFDTTRAFYLWEWEHYPQYYVPSADVDMAVLAAHGAVHRTPQGDVQSYDLHAGDGVRKNAARAIVESPLPGITDTVRFDWKSLDRWFEEDEQIYVHPRGPYTRVDALRSLRKLRIELDGVVLAESPAPVIVFETGLPPRYYVDQSTVNFAALTPSATRTECPYKGTTTGYWHIEIGGKRTADAAWSYAFPTRQLIPIAGLVAFLDEKVDVFIDGAARERPVTHMS